MQAEDKEDSQQQSNCSESTNPLSLSSDGNFETVTTEDTDTTRTHHHSGSTYTSLLGQVGNLHGDLSKTVALCHKLRSENSALKESYERLRAQHLHLHDKYIATRKQAVEESTARISLEQRHDELVQKWRKQLEKKADEFRTLQASLHPAQDIEVLRAQVRKELELKHRETAETLEKQVNKYRKMYYQEKQTYELLKTEFEQYTVNRNSETEATRKRHEENTAGLKEKVNELENMIDAITMQESERKIQLQLEEKKAEVEALEVEVQSLRSEHTARLNELVAENLQLKREAIETKQTARETASETSGLRSKLLLLEKSKADLESQKDRLQSKVVSQDSQVERLEQQLSQAEQLCKKERLIGAEKLAEMSEQANNDKHTLTKQVDALQRKIAQTENESATKFSEMTSEYKATLSARIQEIKALESAMSTLSDRSNEREMDLQSNLQQTQGLLREERELRRQAQSQSDLLSREIAQLEQAKTVLQQKIQQLEEDASTAESQRTTAEARLDELDREYSGLRERYREAVVRQRELKSSQEYAESSLSYKEEEVQQLRVNEAKLRESLAKVEERQVELLDSTQEKENLLKTTLKVELQKGQASAQNRAQRYKKKHTIYRTALSKCKKRISELKKRTGQLEQELASQTQLHQVESESAHRRIRELERERELITRRQLSPGGFNSVSVEHVITERAAQESQIESITRKVDELLDSK